MTAREAFGMRDQRLIEHPLAGGVEPRRLAGMHRRRRHVADAGVAMGVVVQRVRGGRLELAIAYRRRPRTEAQRKRVAVHGGSGPRLVQPA
jgi:hypothetical protein